MRTTIIAALLLAAPASAEAPPKKPVEVPCRMMEIWFEANPPADNPMDVHGGYFGAKRGNRGVA